MRHRALKFRKEPRFTREDVEVGVRVGLGFFVVFSRSVKVPPEHERGAYVMCIPLCAPSHTVRHPTVSSSLPLHEPCQLVVTACEQVAPLLLWVESDGVDGEGRALGVSVA